MNPFRQWRHCYKQRYVCHKLKVVCVMITYFCQVGVPPCQQELRGWKGAAPFPVTGEKLFLLISTTPWLYTWSLDRRLLSEMNLPKENFLYLLTPELPTVAPGTEEWERITLFVTYLYLCFQNKNFLFFLDTFVFFPQWSWQFSRNKLQADDYWWTWRRKGEGLKDIQT